MKQRPFNVKDVITPKEGLIVIKDSYWLCVNGNPEEALFYNSSPQCNRNEQISKSVLDKELYSNMNLQVVFIETAFVPQRD